LEKIVINTPGFRSEILVGESWETVKTIIPENGVVIITDDNVLKIYGDRFPKVPVLSIAPGEASKKLEVIEQLSEKLQDCIIREKSAFDELTGSINEGIILFGSGGLGRRTLKGLRKLKIEPLCFSDNNRDIWNSAIDEVPVYSPQKAIEKYPSATFILCIWSDRIGHPFEDIQNQLNNIKKTKLISFTYLYWKHPEIFLPYFRLDLPHKTLAQFDLVLSTFSLWADEESQKEYLSQIRWRLTSDFKGLSLPVVYSQYFPDDLLQIKQNEVFLDCGAFDGDTLKYFIDRYGNSFGKYIAFEPDPDNFIKLKNYVSGLDSGLRNRISIENFAIGNKQEKLFFDAGGNIQSAISENGNILVDCVTLDQVIGDDICPTYIMMDVEGFEPNIIVGAKKIIEKFSPVIAVAIYHEFDHLWRIPLALNAISNNYKFYLRPHYYSGWELVLYAIPSGR
jgi:FkbM family methyltransferase